MALNYSLKASLHNTDSSMLDHVRPDFGQVMTPSLSVSATLFLLSQGWLREELRHSVVLL